MERTRAQRAGAFASCASVALPSLGAENLLTYLLTYLVALHPLERKKLVWSTSGRMFM